jgi:hypothetical protein
VRLRILALAFALIGVAASAGSSPAAQPDVRPHSDGDALDQLIERSGLGRQLGEFQAAMHQGIDQVRMQDPSFDAARLKRVRTAIDRVYAPNRLRPRLRQEMQRMLSEADIRAALAWIDSPVGRHFSQLEQRATEPARQQRLMEVLQRGTPPALPRARSQLLHELIIATRTDEFGASLVIESAAGTAEGIAGSSSDANRAVLGMRASLETRRAALVQQMHAQSYAVFAVSYAEASDAELQALLRFARSPEGSRFHLYTSQAFEAAAAQAARELGADLAVVPARRAN